MSQHEGQLFDDWPERYDRWFETPIGSLVKSCEGALVMELLAPAPGEVILDAGSGTGVFTLPILAAGASVVGLDISLPMVRASAGRLGRASFGPLVADMAFLPFRDAVFDKSVSITALEFIEDGAAAVAELFRVTKAGGLVVVATLNSASPWAKARIKEARERDTVFRKAVFRSPGDMRALAPFPAEVRTAVHFGKDADPASAAVIEREGRTKRLETGAFIAARWRKPL
jgi:ubiquinone/menaquinone biosynthesis C-methylase UbiE